MYAAGEQHRNAADDHTSDIRAADLRDAFRALPFHLPENGMAHITLLAFYCTDYSNLSGTHEEHLRDRKRSAHGPEVIGSNFGRAELLVRSSSVLSWA